MDIKKDLNDLKEIKNKMLDLLVEAKNILKKYPKHYSTAYSFWIPQIHTALEDHEKWLQRSDYNMQKTIKDIEDSFSKEPEKGLVKIIK